MLLQLKSVGYFLLWNTFWEVVLWSSLCFVHSNIPEGTVCVLRVGGFFFLFFFPFLVKLHILTTAHSDSTVSEEFLSILLCARRELFPLSLQRKSRVGKDLHIDAHSWLLAHPLVCFCREPDRLIQRLLVLNNDMQLLRMSMSFPVFVRSYLVLLWKPNVILNPPNLVSSRGFSHSRKKTVCSGESGLISNVSCSCQACSDDTWKRPNLQQQCESGSGEFLLSVQWI